jgi:hypothetical protein
MAGVFKLLIDSNKSNKGAGMVKVYIALDDHCMKDGYALVTPSLVPSEIDLHIDYLISELEKIRTSAKRRIKTRMVCAG